MQGFNNEKPILKIEYQTSQDWRKRGRDFFPTETILFFLSLYKKGFATL